MEFQGKHLQKYSLSMLHPKKNPPSDPTIPGPGSYDVKALIGKITQRFTLRPKTNFDSTLIQTI